MPKIIHENKARNNKHKRKETTSSDFSIISYGIQLKKLKIPLFLVELRKEIENFLIVLFYDKRNKQ